MARGCTLDWAGPRRRGSAEPGMDRRLPDFIDKISLREGLMLPKCLGPPRLGLATAALLIGSSLALGAEGATVKVWETQVVIPTYLAGEPEPNPMFFFGRASQEIGR